MLLEVAAGHAGTLRCRACGENKAPEQFYKSKVNPGGLTTQCRHCINIEVSQRRYGIANIYEAVEGQSCPVCERPLSMGIRGYAVDHDHTCCPGINTCGACVRGVICSPCNTAIGSFADDPEVIERAAAYLRAWKATR